ncbi:heavy metal transport/detoxification protein [Gordonia polyisoprenivorans VH2]|uniref:Heavy metal transport/detoxification protein n=2 Tax=Gordonia polyisoprenivorans TaxID=84595 RepID=H6MUY2_GORPV|nr:MULTISPECIES: heavy-metal-associated domain-containing protein [Gordonia]AFA71569.1 heavy metal transport/detoxification protein [Gordonia polyisoprenivorans VH2]MBE7195621.1 heavy-metal-associated domain-containing protein [Gordonia polyisoprenivorans]MDF3282958.1 heavy-metal-associated domain-containing protein [Gordonia sp. N1V]NKY00806.1 heavy-metal-associated domain-containing protein [Gordonia polyisoprenivorans]OPX10827.1 cation-transporting ATPase [Gordonia sp. i37]
MASETYTVTGMTCGHCAASVREEIEEIPGVQNVDVTVDSGRVEVTSETPLDREAVARAVTEAGYQLV